MVIYYEKLLEHILMFPAKTIKSFDYHFRVYKLSIVLQFRRTQLLQKGAYRWKFSPKDTYRSSSRVYTECDGFPQRRIQELTRLTARYLTEKSRKSVFSLFLFYFHLFVRKSTIYI